jgi:hypothetical protein
MRGLGHSDGNVRIIPHSKLVASSGDLSLAAIVRQLGLGRPVLIIGCLILAPIGVLVRLRRRVSLVISPDGISLARRGRILPEHLLAWHDVEEVVYERATTRGPKALACLLTEEATRRLRGRGLNPRLLIRGGFVLSPRRLHPVLAAAHARFSAHSHGRR